MKKLSLLALTLASFAAVPAFACSCGPSTRADTIDEADVVFTGTVEKVESEGFWNVATVKVDDVAKGTVDEEVKVQTASQSAACGVELTVGKTIELAAIQRKDRLHVSSCSQLGLSR